MNLLPKVGLEDVPAALHIVQGELREIICNRIDYPLNLYHAGTNGIYYQQVLIQIPDEIVQSPYFNLLSILMGEVGAGEYSYLELQQLQTAMIGGLGKIGGQSFMIVGQQKGYNTKTRQYRNFGMANPEGYRKALRLMKMAEKGVVKLDLISS